MDRAVGQMPACGSPEGLAEFYSTFDVTDGGKTAQLGGDPATTGLWDAAASLLQQLTALWTSRGPRQLQVLQRTRQKLGVLRRVMGARALPAARQGAEIRRSVRAVFWLRDRQRRAVPPRLYHRCWAWRPRTLEDELRKYVLQPGALPVGDTRCPDRIGEGRTYSHLDARAGRRGARAARQSPRPARRASRRP